MNELSFKEIGKQIKGSKTKTNKLERDMRFHDVHKLKKELFNLNLSDLESEEED
jgi:hypothetical protein